MKSVKASEAGKPLTCSMRVLQVFFILAMAVLFGITDGVDRDLMHALQGWSSPELTRLALSLSRIGSAYAIYGMAATVGLVLLLLGHRFVAFHLAIVMGAAFLANSFVKLMVARPRPVPIFGEAPETYSFASGHALMSACFFGFIGMLVTARMPEAWQRAVILIPIFALIGCIGAARVYQGVHYPSDVLGGFLLGAAILCAFGPRAADRPGGR